MVAKYMTIEQILDSARETIDENIAKCTFTGNEGCEDNEENFYTMESLYAEWVEDENEAIESLWLMFEQEYNEYF